MHKMQTSLKTIRYHFVFSVLSELCEQDQSCIQGSLCNFRVTI